MIFLQLCLVIAVHIIHANVNKGQTKPGDVHLHFFGLESAENYENRLIDRGLKELRGGNRRLRQNRKLRGNRGLRGNKGFGKTFQNTYFHSCGFWSLGTKSLSLTHSCRARPIFFN